MAAQLPPTCGAPQQPGIPGLFPQGTTTGHRSSYGGPGTHYSIRRALESMLALAHSWSSATLIPFPKFSHSLLEEQTRQMLGSPLFVMRSERELQRLPYEAS